MLSRSSLRQNARRALRQQCSAKPFSRRGLAAPASGSFQYQTSDVSGTKVASRDIPGPTTTLAMVAKAGTRYQWLPGLAEGLEKFAFKGTEKRTTVRMIREIELLGGEINAYHTRENIVIGAKFLRDDLPYFVELLGEIASETRFLEHVYHEEVEKSIKLSQQKHLASTAEMALNSVHGLAFHRGLGEPLSPSSSTPLTKYLDASTIQAYASAAYAKSNVAVVANGADSAELNKWVGEYFSELASTAPSSVPKIETTQSKYFGGEERIAHASGNTMVLGFSGSSSFTGGFYKPEIAVIGSLLGGQSNIKWSPGFALLSKATSELSYISVDTKSHIYSDAGLLAIKLEGHAVDVRKAAFKAVEALKSIADGKVSSEDVKKAVASAKFKELEFGQNLWAGIELTGSGLVQNGKAYQLDESAKAIEGVTPEAVRKVAKALLESKASVSSVGDLFVLPFADEIGLQM
ncbi:LuxS/MPP-like metallohydrolase [Aulographum hederae CBS 113979]|uniref:Cytochrome b-c1 complex subunit 2, mitochondrial n=1 Tax=Aulographum hederae CBS 113979 TaxID=1176131 RepID=A0A6G1HBU0_9PEZI|nr:LuxS/MPP-like metallohydrolase [Aulographum hederae CBS 113979]